MTDKDEDRSAPATLDGKAITDVLLGRDRSLSRKLALEYVLTDRDKELLGLVGHTGSGKMEKSRKRDSTWSNAGLNTGLTDGMVEIMEGEYATGLALYELEPTPDLLRSLQRLERLLEGHKRRKNNPPETPSKPE